MLLGWYSGGDDDDADDDAGAGDDGFLLLLLFLVVDIDVGNPKVVGADFRGDNDDDDGMMKNDG